ncbi:hypothetical protein [Neobacillus dielmonensis]|uniref:hypothetical protein n=1 Tax=Neobacillus dielmonensis TaxID=1347369 RepID=UPI0009438650|nr:hypothetical protein [Neobacillus dielmonensis]
MSEKKGKVIHVDNLIIHAKNVEIVDPESVKINHGRHEENNMEDHFPRRDPWGFFWGPPPREEEHEHERHHNESPESSSSSSSSSNHENQY